MPARRSVPCLRCLSHHTQQHSLMKSFRAFYCTQMYTWFIDGKDRSLFRTCWPSIFNQNLEWGAGGGDRVEQPAHGIHCQSDTCITALWALCAIASCSQNVMRNNGVIAREKFDFKKVARGKRQENCWHLLHILIARSWGVSFDVFIMKKVLLTNHNGWLLNKMAAGEKNNVREWEIM